MTVLTLLQLNATSSNQCAKNTLNKKRGKRMLKAFPLLSTRE